MKRLTMAVGAAGAVLLVTGSAGAQVRAANIPPGQMPPPGMCRVWIDGVPPGRQPRATDCATAQTNRTANARVIYGSDVRGHAAVDPRYPRTTLDPRYDSRSSTYDPRYDSHSASYDPRYDSRSNSYDPRYDSRSTSYDARLDPRSRSYDPGYANRDRAEADGRTSHGKGHGGGKHEDKHKGHEDKQKDHEGKHGR